MLLRGCRILLALLILLVPLRRFISRGWFFPLRLLLLVLRILRGVRLGGRLLGLRLRLRLLLLGG